MSGGKRVMPKVSGLVRPPQLTDEIVAKFPVLGETKPAESQTPGATDKESKESGAGVRLMQRTPTPTTSLTDFRNQAAPGEESTQPGSADNAAPSDAATSVMLPLSMIRPSPFQNRNRDETHIADLSVIINEDGLNQPITVRHLAQENIYEIIAGENRYEACKLLGHTEIPVYIKNSDDLGAARSLIFDNIHHKPLTDYEIYRGFKTLQEMDEKTSIRTLAQDTGWSAGQVQKILSFKKLPLRAHEILTDNPEILGATAALSLAQHTEAGLGDLVNEAIELIKDGKLTQTRAATWVESKARPRSKKAEKVLTSNDGKGFCSISRKGSVLNVKLAKHVEIDDIEQKVFEFLKTLMDTGNDG